MEEVYLEYESVIKKTKPKPWMMNPTRVGHLALYQMSLLLLELKLQISAKVNIANATNTRDGLLTSAEQTHDSHSEAHSKCEDDDAPHFGTSTGQQNTQSTNDVTGENEASKSWMSTIGIT